MIEPLHPTSSAVSATIKHVSYLNSTVISSFAAYILLESPDVCDHAKQELSYWYYGKLLIVERVINTAKIKVTSVLSDIFLQLFVDPVFL